tara:strand:+ start:186 stop:353 length:168 start_codon:yes stop_codon:yes gene_type:complete
MAEQKPLDVLPNSPLANALSQPQLMLVKHQDHGLTKLMKRIKNDRNARKKIKSRV